MKYRRTITLDEEVSEVLEKQHDDSGAPVSFLVNRILRKEFKLK